ncbi:MAG: oxaloacetate decarboxylase subunit alpha, partial [Oscillospiraceae bacterium]|nr:oxaloacetate decarboxylase subunit alpha [Oscillospiraceae bacterium]
MRRIGITETAIRDAHQSLIATRMTYGDMEGALRHMDEVGYWSIEGWGGATFDACVRFLGEDPWERLRSIKKLIRKTKIQMLLRGQNLLGYRHYADDTVDCFVRRCVANGVDVVRIFDALNDERNVERAVKACKAEGGHAQATICYTTGPAYGTGYFSGLAVRLAEMGADSLCVKDMA